MDGFYHIDQYLDRVDHDRVSDAIAAATTDEEVAEIQAQCQHRYKIGSKDCWVCGYEQPDDPNFDIDDIPF